MTKNDLKHGNVVELRNGLKYFCYILGDYKLINFEETDFIYLSYYDTDLTHYNKDKFEKYDIMKVYKDYTLNELLWERKEGIPKLSDDEKAILRNLPKIYKYIARDKRNSLIIFEEKPEKYKEYNGWIDDFFLDEYLDIFNNLFQFIKWEDEEPYLIEDLLKGSD